MKTSYSAYGSLGFALSVVGIPLYIYLPTFYSQNVGIEVATVGVVLLLARLLDMFFDPLVGYLSDHSTSAYGARKPFILMGSVLLLIGYGALITPPQEGFQVIWLFLFSLLMYGGWSLISVPYMTMSSEITSDYHAKTTLSSYREVMAIMGMMAALILPYSLGIADNSAQTLKTLFLLLALTLPVTLLWFFLKVDQKALTLPPQPFRSGVKIILQSNGVHLLSAYTINALANAIPSTLFLYYVSLVLGEKEQSGLLLLLYFFAGIIALPFWLYLSRRITKRSSWIASMLLASSAFIFVPFLDNILYFGVIVLISGFSLGADLVLSSSMQADLAQHYEKQGHRVSGVLFGLWGMGTKLSLALGVGIAFGILGLVGFKPNEPSALSLETLTWLYAIAPVVFKLLSISLLLRYKEIK
jgi:Na+/melibiose symporter-like transporter